MSFDDELAHSSPEVCVTTPPSTASSNPPVLRWVVGQGASRNLAARASLSDEAYIALWHAPEDEFRSCWFPEGDQPTPTSGDLP